MPIATNPFKPYSAHPTGIGDAALLEVKRQMLNQRYDEEMAEKIGKLAPPPAIGFSPAKTAVHHLYGPLELLLC